MTPRVADPDLRLTPHAVLLRRGPGELQIGVEPSVVVPAELGPLVRTLARGVDPDTLAQLAQADGLAPEALSDLLAALADARLLRPAPPATPQAVRVVGAGTLGAGTAEELVRAGVDALYLADLPGRPSLEAEPDHEDRRRARRADRPDRADLLAAALAHLRPGVHVRRTRHFVKPEGGVVGLTVVVADGPEPDRLVTDLLREHGAPHLLVRCSGDEAVVGPLVVPGSTSCVRCADLTRCDADPRWPWLLHQLTHLAVAPSPTLLAWAAVTATVQVLAYLGGARPETVGHTLELDGAEHALRLRAWAVHPTCPCRWDAAAPTAPTAQSAETTRSTNPA